MNKLLQDMIDFLRKKQESQTEEGAEWRKIGLVSFALANIRKLSVEQRLEVYDALADYCDEHGCED